VERTTGGGVNFLLEIGTEEIPHWMILDARVRLLSLFTHRLCLDNGFAPDPDPRVDATPRRLVIRAEGLPERTPDQPQVIKGPPISAGEKAAAGFAKKQGVELSTMEKVGDYYELRKNVPGCAVRELFADLLPGMILGIQWPKTMYWGSKGSPRFIRPIRWIVALLDDELIPFEVAGVASGNRSRGHRVLGNEEFKVSYASFENALRAMHVILSAGERREKIRKEAAGLGATIDADLLETLTYITEYPAAIKGDFDPSYLELPAEVLTMVMRHHQKYFAVEKSPGVLAPHFVAIMNMPSDPEGHVKQGNERVLKARFNDARFFWEVDQKKKLADRVEDLSHVTFQAKLGSYLDKTNRVVELVKELSGDADAQRAALLCKADLTTEMVKEFTDLQGIVGGLYAKHQGENETVSQAIYEHYKPLSMEDSIPSTAAGQIVAIADKLDNLREFFRIGMEPTGSKDPFALRRAALGIVTILIEAQLPIQWNVIDSEFMRERVQYYFREIRGARKIIRQLLESTGGEQISDADRATVRAQLEAAGPPRDALIERPDGTLTTLSGDPVDQSTFKYDEINAAVAAGIATLADLQERLRALARVRSSPNFEPIAASFKRIRKIIPGDFAPQRSVRRELLEEGPERDLYEAFSGKA
jgi:glycyl-tRNA synthetase beta chain